MFIPSDKGKYLANSIQKKGFKILSSYGLAALNSEIKSLKFKPHNFRFEFMKSCMRIASLVNANELNEDIAKVELTNIAELFLEPKDIEKLWNSALRKAKCRKPNSSKLLPWFRDIYERRICINEWINKTQNDKTLRSTDRAVCEYLGSVMLRSGKFEISCSYRQVSLEVGIALPTVSRVASRLHPKVLLVANAQGTRTSTKWKLSPSYLGKSQSQTDNSTKCYRPAKAYCSDLRLTTSLVDFSLDFWSSSKGSREVFADVLIALSENSGRIISSDISTCVSRATLFRHLKHFVAEGLLIKTEESQYVLSPRIEELIPITYNKKNIKEELYKKQRCDWNKAK